MRLGGEMMSELMREFTVISRFKRGLSLLNAARFKFMRIKSKPNAWQSTVSCVFEFGERTVHCVTGELNS